MEKRISFNDFQSVKRVAQACNPFMASREKVKTKIEKLAQEYNDYDTQIKELEAGIQKVYGFRVEQLIQKVTATVKNADGTERLDANGKPMKTTKWLPTSIVSYDEAKKQYVVTFNVENTPSAPVEEPQNEVAEETVSQEEVVGESIF